MCTSNGLFLWSKASHGQNFFSMQTVDFVINFQLTIIWTIDWTFEKLLLVESSGYGPV